MVDSSAKNRSATSSDLVNLQNSIKNSIVQSELNKYRTNYKETQAAKTIPASASSNFPSYSYKTASKSPTKNTTKAAVISPNSSDVQPYITETDYDYKWNLPPHSWSLPVDPSDLHSDYVKKDITNFHATRRGRIFFSNRAAGSQKQVNPKTGKFELVTQNDLKYGFQFMWNPETYTQNTGLNMNNTPSETDPVSGVLGLVSANSTLSFTLRLDRTNDFACAKSVPLRSESVNTTTLAGINAASTTESVTQLHQFYSIGQPVKSENDFSVNLSNKIIDLLKYGTGADIEYLYRVINGGGFTVLGLETSNIGYLTPTIVRVDLGPQKFMGIISNVSVNHIGFTRSMIPIRTDVTVTVDLRAGTGYATSGVTGSTVPGSNGGTP